MKTRSETDHKLEEGSHEPTVFTSWMGGLAQTIRLRLGAVTLGESPLGEDRFAANRTTNDLAQASEQLRNAASGFQV